MINKDVLTKEIKSQIVVFKEFVQGLENSFLTNYEDRFLAPKAHSDLIQYCDDLLDDKADDLLQLFPKYRECLRLQLDKYNTSDYAYKTFMMKRLSSYQLVEFFPSLKGTLRYEDDYFHIDRFNVSKPKHMGNRNYYFAVPRYSRTKSLTDFHAEKMKMIQDALFCQEQIDIVNFFNDWNISSVDEWMNNLYKLIHLFFYLPLYLICKVIGYALTPLTVLINQLDAHNPIQLLLLYLVVLIHNVLQVAYSLSLLAIKYAVTLPLQLVMEVLPKFVELIVLNIYLIFRFLYKNLMQCFDSSYELPKRTQTYWDCFGWSPSIIVLHLFAALIEQPWHDFVRLFIFLPVGLLIDISHQSEGCHSRTATLFDRWHRAFKDYCSQSVDHDKNTETVELNPNSKNPLESESTETISLIDKKCKYSAWSPRFYHCNIPAIPVGLISLPLISQSGNQRAINELSFHEPTANMEIKALSQVLQPSH